GLVGVREERPGAHERLVVALDQILRLRVEAESVAPFVDRLHAGEQTRVHINLVLVRGELGRFLGLDLLNGRVCVGLRESEEDSADAREQRARALHRLDSVRERRRLGAAGYRLDLDELTFHALFERGLVVALLYLVEWRRLE